jgi:hypothetical protein
MWFKRRGSGLPRRLEVTARPADRSPGLSHRCGGRGAARGSSAQLAWQGIAEPLALSAPNPPEPEARRPQ